MDKKRLEEEAMVVREGAAMALVWIALDRWLDALKTKSMPGFPQDC